MSWSEVSADARDTSTWCGRPGRSNSATTTATSPATTSATTYPAAGAVLRAQGKHTDRAPRLPLGRLLGAHLGHGRKHGSRPGSRLPLPGHAPEVRPGTGPRGPDLGGVARVRRRRLSGSPRIPGLGYQRSQDANRPFPGTYRGRFSIDILPQGGPLVRQVIRQAPGSGRVDAPGTGFTMKSTFRR